MVAGGTAHGQGTDHVDQLVCLEVPPASVYKGAKGGAAGPRRRHAGGVLLLPGVGLPPFPSWIRTWGEGGEGRKERGALPPPLLVQFGLGGRGARQPLGLLSSSSTRPIKAH